ncbi:DUF4245 domain-containing protein [Ornithinimicrobium sp. F0845]|uniref:DUF4245 domain-containing protein n=1 Tax=Ornithinimicrobium sp. F0845 TaxID=2926412 RepID=UPI001FF460FE|nr:DUF4245 domain-containing protein [Ornithinimicrobium sp. F0845]MCK0111007.1 DUF4245 domain-containing protein [Ornithinimicrobium sp. F0845]
MSSPTETQPTPPQQENKAVNRLRNYSVKNMIYSLLAVFALAFAWWALMPNPDKLERRPVEVAPVATYAATESEFPVWTPEDLGEEWTANFATLETYAGALSWRVGLVTPGEEYVEISQSADATDEWMGVLTEKAGEQVGTRTITGPDGVQEWDAYEGEERAVVLEPAEGREATTVVRGTADWDEIEEFIGLLEVAG